MSAGDEYTPTTLAEKTTEIARRAKGAIALGPSTRIVVPLGVLVPSIIFLLGISGAGLFFLWNIKANSDAAIVQLKAIQPVLLQHAVLWEDYKIRKGSDRLSEVYVPTESSTP